MEASICPRLHLGFALLLIAGVLFASPPYAGAESAKPPATKGAAAAPGGNGLQRRIDFGNSYILGQSIKSGAVYLLHRKKSEINSMLHYRDHYRDEILEDFSVQADGELGQDGEAGLTTETLEPMKKKVVRK